MLRQATSAFLALSLVSAATAQCEYVNDTFANLQPGVAISALNNWTTSGVAIVGLYPGTASPSAQFSTTILSSATRSLTGAGLPSVFSVTFDVDTGTNSSFGLGCPGTAASRATVAFDRLAGTITSLEPGGISTPLIAGGSNTIRIDVDLNGDYEVIANGVSLLSGPWTASGLPTCPAPDELIFATTETGFFGLTPMYVDNICIGDIPLDYTTYCGVQTPNSTGVVGTMSATGSNNVGLNTLTVTASNLPVNKFGMFLASQVQDERMYQVNSAYLCLDVANSSGFARFDSAILFSGANGEFSQAIDLTQIPGATGNYAVLAGQTLNFQAWHRDDAPTIGAHMSDAISIVFN